MPNVSMDFLETLGAVLDMEPVDGLGQCPWCEVFRATSLGSLRQEHRSWCPWAQMQVLWDGVSPWRRAYLARESQGLDR
jgi:hypothetical protein